MAARKKDSGSEPQEWREGQERARAARALVAAQIAENLTEQDMTGSGDAFASRVVEVAEARRMGDPALLRAAVMEAVTAGGAWIVALDLRQGT